MIASIRSLPNWIETALVIVAAFGTFALSAFYEAIEPSSTAYIADDFVYLAQYEIIVGAVLLGFLFVRGWRMERLGFVAPNWRDLLHALLLCAAVFAANWSLWIAFGDPSAQNPLTIDGPGVPIGVAIAFSLINAIYEEVFVCAYIVAASRSVGVLPAVLLSTVVRLSYHVYQGPLVFIMIGPVGLLFAWYFASRGRIWPLIFVHFALDAVALLPYMRV